MSDDREPVDVRDMLCAQALAHVEAAMRSARPGGLLTVVADAADVVHDLEVWSRERGHALAERKTRAEETWLRIRKQG
ncbi:MAG: sulfurtransferase TusA family protein [Candidatus Omnitrophica bacterium]|nr:sulfurtransferase TusA family protein [Candidatus Omnitrophota bacterium]